MTTPRRGLRAVSHEDHLYAIGGYNGAFLKSVERAQVDNTGAITKWEAENESSVVDRYIHSAAILDDHIYLLAGHVQNSEKMSYGDVESTRILASGALSPWQIEPSTLKQPRFIASSAALNGFLYLIGGHNGEQRLSSVEYAPVLQSGSVGSWRYTANLNTPRSATTVVTNGRALYAIGGSGPNGLLNTVEVTQQRGDGRLGFPVDISAKPQ